MSISSMNFRLRTGPAVVLRDSWPCSPLRHRHRPNRSPVDQATFLAEMTAFMEDADKKEGKPFMEDDFAPAWNGTFYNTRPADAHRGGGQLHAEEALRGLPRIPGLSRPRWLPSRQPAQCATEFDAWMNCLENAGRSTPQTELRGPYRHVRGPVQGQHILQERQRAMAEQQRASSPSPSTAYPRSSSPRMDLRCLAKGDSA